MIDRKIDHVRADPTCIADFCGDRPLLAPEPVDAATLDQLTFPSGKPLPPSQRRRLAFDASWLRDLGWFAPVGGSLRFTPRPVDAIVTEQLGAMWGKCYAPLGQRLAECFLLPGGSDSRRIYAVTEQPDTLGEYPVFAVDVDDLPFLGLMYPGFDVFMGGEAGVCTLDFPTYEGLFDDSCYTARLNEHARQLLGGKQSIEMYDEEWGALDGVNPADGDTGFSLDD